MTTRRLGWPAPRRGRRAVAVDRDSTGPPGVHCDRAGRHDEIWLRGGSQARPEFPTEKEWLRSVNMLVDAGSKGQQVRAQTKLWTHGDGGSGFRLAPVLVASFLLGTDGSYYPNFSVNQTLAALLRKRRPRPPLGVPPGRRVVHYLRAYGSPAPPRDGDFRCGPRH